jgi:molybdenum cofactor biosynthesis enzyme MoaA
MPSVSVSEGKIVSLKIEYNLTEHCNYGCAECSHFSPYLAKKESSLATFVHDLEALAKVLRVYRFRFVGGNYSTGGENSPAG